MPILRELLNNVQYKYLESFKSIFLSSLREVERTRAECARQARAGKPYPYGEALAAYRRADADYREQVGGSAASDGSRSGRSAADVYSSVRSMIADESDGEDTMRA